MAKPSNADWTAEDLARQAEAAADIEAVLWRTSATNTITVAAGKNDVVYITEEGRSNG